MMSGRSTACGQLELKIYRFLGVDRFRKGLLRLERLRHRRGGRNENYHPAGSDIAAMERYSGFLLYNASLHVASLIMTALYGVFAVASGFHSLFLNLAMAALTVLNLYCILLQRANELKLKKLRARYRAHVKKRGGLREEEAIQKVYVPAPHQMRADYEVLCRMKNAFDGREDCVLTGDDAESLKRIRACLALTSGEKKTGRRKDERAEVGLIERCGAALYPYTALQARVDRLQKRLGVSGRRMLARSAIITEDAASEMLYKELFPEDTDYYFCLVCVLLHEVYAGMIDKVGANGE